MKVVLVTFRDGERRDTPLTADRSTLGRATDCTVRVPAGDVSRHHCEIVVNAGGVTVRDLGSSNGTFVNGKRIAETSLKAGDRLTLGPVTFAVQIDGKPGKLTPHDLASPVAPKAPAVAVDDEADTEEMLDLDDIDFDLEDPMASLESPDLDDDDEPASPPKG